MSWMVIGLVLWVVVVAVVWAMCRAAARADARMVAGEARADRPEVEVAGSAVAVVDVFALRMRVAALSVEAGADLIEVYAGDQTGGYGRQLVCSVGALPVAELRSAVVVPLLREQRIVGSVVASRGAASRPFDELERQVLAAGATALAPVFGAVLAAGAPDATRFGRAGDLKRASTRRHG